jgi:hypothetical protein
MRLHHSRPSRARRRGGPALSSAGGPRLRAVRGGVYLVAATAEPDAHIDVPHCPIAMAAVSDSELVVARPELTLDFGVPRRRNWLDVCIILAPRRVGGLRQPGLGAALRSRVGAYYSTRLGPAVPTPAGGRQGRRRRGPRSGALRGRRRPRWDRALDAGPSARACRDCQARHPRSGSPSSVCDLEWPPVRPSRHDIKGASAARLRRPRP